MTKNPSNDNRPNILLVVADDLAFTDIGAFGGEIETPNLDALAASGVRLTQFYVAPTCSPTRSMLLSGTDNHLAGLGNMAEELRENQQANPGYEGYLNFRVAALPELLQDAGYHTYMAGKWHLGMTAETSPGARGFERYFCLLQGGAGHLDQMPLVGPKPAVYEEDGERINLPEDFYSSRTYSERMIEYLENRPKDGKPFFGYLTYTAPHWPLQAPNESIEKYAGKYDSGYDALQASRFKKMQELGLTTPSMKVMEPLPSEKTWDLLSDEEKRIEARKMEIYAAMVDDLDHYLGTVLESLKNSGDFEHTLIIFMSDNGGLSTSEGSPTSNLPLRAGKGAYYEGGIRAPLVVRWAEKIIPGTTCEIPVSGIDFFPTFLEAAAAATPDGTQLDGVSLMPLLTQTGLIKERPLFWHFPIYLPEGNSETRDPKFRTRPGSVVRYGAWKLHEYFEDGGFELYNLKHDIGEKHDLAGTEPEKVKELHHMLRAWHKQTGAPLPSKTNPKYKP